MGDVRGLSRQDTVAIEEEESLLARVRALLEARAARRRGGSGRRGRQALVSDLRELRDEARDASPDDLSAIFQEMGALHALLEKEESGVLPEAAMPYFAHLRLRTARGVRDYLLGRATFTDAAAGVRIVDWRFAPIAKIFYGYQEGEDFEEELPGGLLEGTVEVRRVVVIERGLLTRILGGPLSLVREADGAWCAESGGPVMLAGGSGTAARAGCLGVGSGATQRRRGADVTALLDAEQFEAVNAPSGEPLLVLGSAGSGKTTVALHRLARLAFEEPSREPRMRLIVPEEGLARLSRRLLEPLGLTRVEVRTLAAWSLRAACAAFAVSRIKIAPETPALVSRFKRHPALRGLLLERFGSLPKSALTLPRLRRRLADVFTDRAFLRTVVDGARGDLPRPVIDDVVRHTMLQLATPLARELEGFDPERIKAVDGRALEDGTPDALAGTLDLEDLPLLLFLKAWNGAMAPEGLAHLVLDEAEDFSVFELFVLGRLLDGSRSCTVAGDELQQTLPSFPGWEESLATLGLSEAAVCRLQVSYRCPRPIARFARQLLGPLASGVPAQGGRDGVPVGVHHFVAAAQAQLFIAEALRDLTEREPRASVAVIASTPDEARALKASLVGLAGVRLILSGEFSFEPGIDVTDVENVKGLEFDYVIVPDATAEAYPESDEARRRLHVAATRASHQLWIVSAGRRSPIVSAVIGGGTD